MILYYVMYNIILITYYCIYICKYMLMKLIMCAMYEYVMLCCNMHVIMVSSYIPGTAANIFMSIVYCFYLFIRCSSFFNYPEIQYNSIQDFSSPRLYSLITGNWFNDYSKSLRVID